MKVWRVVRGTRPPVYAETGGYDEAWVCTACGAVIPIGAELVMVAYDAAGGAPFPPARRCEKFHSSCYVEEASE